MKAAKMCSTVILNDLIFGFKCVNNMVNFYIIKAFEAKVIYTGEIFCFFVFCVSKYFALVDVDNSRIDVNKLQGCHMTKILFLFTIISVVILQRIKSSS